eukprot:30829-Pelagococcus_subviridis.AAC.8
MSWSDFAIQFTSLPARSSHGANTNSSIDRSASAYSAQHSDMSAYTESNFDQVDVDDRNALELLQLREERRALPRLRKQQLQRVHGHRADVVIPGHDLAANELDPGHAHAVVRRQKLFHSSAEPHGSASAHEVLRHRRAQAVGLVPVQKRRLRPVRLVDEPVHRGQDDRHRELIRVDEIQRLSHRDEELLAHAFGHEVPTHPLLDAELVLRVDVVLPAQQHRHERRAGPELLRRRQHPVVG